MLKQSVIAHIWEGKYTICIHNKGKCEYELSVAYQLTKQILFSLCNK